MPFEDELTEALHSTADGFRPDLTALVNAGVRDGRRRGRRRTMGVVGSVVALALVGVGGAAASGALTGEQTTRTAGPAALTVTHPPKGAAKPTAAASVLPKFSAGQTLAALEALLPKGDTVTRAHDSGFTSTSSHGLSFVSGPMVSLVLDDGSGGSLIQLTVTRPAGSLDDPGLQQYVACPGHYRPDITCTRTHLADGSVLALMLGLESPKSSSKEKDWTAWLATEDGGLIELDETNSAQEKGGITRPEPILTKDQLASVASAPIWRSLAAKLPAPLVR